ncbi:MAG: hypothetical protein ACR2IH_03050 [Pyrinomonadaceae bacterium]
MSDETTKDGEELDAEAKPTITIAEKQGGNTAPELAEKPTITIAEKNGN